MTKFSLLFAAGVASILYSCTGEVPNMTKLNGVVELDDVKEVRINAPTQKIDTVLAVVDGEFTLELPTDITSIVNLEVNGTKAQFIADGTDLDISIADVIKVSSKHPESVQNKYADISNKLQDMNMTMRNEYYALADKADIPQDILEQKLDSTYNHHMELIKNASLEAFALNTDNYITLSLLNQLSNMLEIDELEVQLSKVSDELKEHKYVKSIVSYIESVKATAEGKMFTDFTVPDSNGKEEKLSNYVGKGKYVLVDFWASWCGPCKHEIPNLKNIYDKYKGDNFDILSVAVWDRSPQASLDTAAAYGVSWNHIINAERKPAEIYGVKGIPFIMLIGPDGTIIKRGLRGEQIEEEILKYIK